jgi:two-component system chemotaxis sensor kinase CheA
MAIDLSQFYQVFFEEAQEHLDSMEALLLDLDLASPDEEQLNAIFRAAHSIKGSAGTFGFTDLAEVTHVLENLLDRIRKGELALRPNMIDAFLDAGDLLKDLLAAHRGDGSADPVRVAETCQRLASLTGNTGTSESHAEPVSAPAESTAANAQAGSLDVSFLLDEGTSNADAAIANLVAEIAEHWTCSVVDPRRRVASVEKVDQLINLVGELVITQAMLAQSASVLDPVQFERLHNGLAQLERNTRDMQESVMSIRMMPISVVFSASRAWCATWRKNWASRSN